MKMISELTNHLWQSTVFAVSAGLLTIAFRQNRAHVRYWLWLSASLKFLLPFALLISLGNLLEWAPVTQTVSARPGMTTSLMQVSRPFSAVSVPMPSETNAHDWIGIAIFGMWLFGFAGIALIRFRGWLSICAAVRSSTPAGIAWAFQVRSSPGLLEPGVVGLFRPVLLVPVDIDKRLEPPQLQAVLAHELCHIRRRDNLTSAIHMAVEAIFWFHPLTWWIGARLVEERERACDEAVLSLGNEPYQYAEGILKICKSYLASPLSCVSGVTGSNLKKRIQAILTERVGRDLTFAKKLTLSVSAVAALVAPIAVGSINAPRLAAKSQFAAEKFRTVSIRPCNGFRRSDYLNLPPGTFHSGCTSLERLIQQAYGVFADGHAKILSSITVTGGPAWTKSDLYEIDAKSSSPQNRANMNGPMLQALLEDRFKLRFHRQSREVPVYALTLWKDGPPLRPFEGGCVSWDYDNPPSHPAPPSERCGRGRPWSKGVALDAATMADLCYFFLVALDRPVIDQTGMPGRYDFELELPTNTKFFRQPHTSAPGSDPAMPPPDPSFVSAIKAAANKLGLNLKPTEGPGEVVIIDHIERPSRNL